MKILKRKTLKSPMKRPIMRTAYREYWEPTYKEYWKPTYKEYWEPHIGNIENRLQGIFHRIYRRLEPKVNQLGICKQS